MELFPLLEVEGDEKFDLVQENINDIPLIGFEKESTHGLAAWEWSGELLSCMCLCMGLGILAGALFQRCLSRSSRKVSIWNAGSRITRRRFFKRSGIGGEWSFGDLRNQHGVVLQATVRQHLEFTMTLLLSIDECFRELDLDRSIVSLVLVVKASEWRCFRRLRVEGVSEEAAAW